MNKQICALALIGISITLVACGDESTGPSSSSQTSSSSVVMSSSLTPSSSSVTPLSSSTILSSSIPNSSSSMISSALSSSMLSSSRISSSSLALSYGTLVDGTQSYKTIKIDKITWMAENLNKASTAGASWCFNNATDSCAKYGQLYTWEAATNASNNVNVNIQGICPANWVLPTESDWTELLKHDLDSLKSTLFKGNNGLGLGLMLSGNRSPGVSGKFENFGLSAGFWTANEAPMDGITYATAVSVGKYSAPIFGALRENGFAVRCIQK